MKEEGKYDEHIVSYHALRYTFHGDYNTTFVVVTFCTNIILSQKSYTVQKVNKLSSGVTNFKIKTPYAGAEGDKLTFINAHFDVFCWFV